MKTAPQFVMLRAAGWRIEVLPEPIVVPERRAAPSRHNAPRHHFVEKPTHAPETPCIAPAPLGAIDKAKAARFDDDQTKIKSKAQADKDLNAVVFENDTPWSRRPSRANVGYARVKSRYWR